jgi:hypothetical protein
MKIESYVFTYYLVQAYSVEKSLAKETTKKERIVELLRKGIPPEQIALEVDTSVQYVYKETSRYNKKNELIEMHRQESLSGINNELVRRGQASIEFIPKSNLPVTSESEQVIKSYNEFESLSKEDTRNLYRRFLKNHDAAHVISVTGLRPDLVQKEHVRFLEMKSRNPFELQDLIISEIRDGNPDLEPLINKARSRRLLSNTDIIMLINYNSRSLVDFRISKLISNPQIPLPPGLDRIKCNLCGRFQPGIIIDKNSEFAKQHEAVFAKCLCESCLTKAMAIKKNDWNFGIYGRTEAISEGAERVNSMSVGASSVKTEEVNKEKSVGPASTRG